MQKYIVPRDSGQMRGVPEARKDESSRCADRVPREGQNKKKFVWFPRSKSHQFAFILFAKTNNCRQLLLHTMADESVQPPALDNLNIAEDGSKKSSGQIVTPFDVSGGVDESGKLLPVDYDKLVREFGATPLTPDLLERFEKVTGHRPHRFMRRGVVFSHRELGKILDRHEKGQPFYLYTGRGPSSDSMHVGHTVPFEFTKYVFVEVFLQEPSANLIISSGGCKTYSTAP